MPLRVREGYVLVSNRGLLYDVKIKLYELTPAFDVDFC